MKTVVLYRSRSEHARAVEAFVSDFERETRLTVQRQELDSKEGAETARLYDVIEYPAVLVTREDGSLVRVWAGANLPPVPEVAHEAR